MRLLAGRALQRYILLRRHAIVRLANDAEVTRVWLIGSAARGDAARKSDIDLLVDGGDELGHFLLAEAWERILGRRIDLVTYAAVEKWDDVDQTKVARDAIPLHDPGADQTSGLRFS